ncbi:uncharacterized protein LOC133320152 [Danaus plexippus]|uniref:uncharacterized protein LOC133320152 n=1 Tax=Danaus plexippus TaxID=13037 RepID=UPI002AB21A19|nr:uncharacterized protein LOC133320152 [Danaus plexippus]
MFQTCKGVLVVLSFLIIAARCGLEIIPERTKVIYVNQKYFYNLSLEVKKYSRTSPYYYNVDVTTKQPWTNNVTLHISFNEYVQNEYRSSFIELHRKFCDLMKFDKIIGNMIKYFGIDCPLPAGTLRLINVTVVLNTLPNVFPFQKCRIATEVKITATNESMTVFHNYVTFKDTKRTG